MTVTKRRAGTVRITGVSIPGSPLKITFDPVKRMRAYGISDLSSWSKAWAHERALAVAHRVRQGGTRGARLAHTETRRLETRQRDAALIAAAAKLQREDRAASQRELANTLAKKFYLSPERIRKILARGLPPP